MVPLCNTETDRLDAKVPLVRIINQLLCCKLTIVIRLQHHMLSKLLRTSIAASAADSSSTGLFLSPREESTHMSAA